jgi:mono/diheme cytochrome c family protein
MNENTVRNRVSMKRVGGLLGLTAFASACLGGCDLGRAGRPDGVRVDEALSAEASAVQAQVARGKYLVTIGGCNDCHTPLAIGPKGPEPDMTRMLTGHPADVAMPPAPALSGGWMWAGAATNTAFAGPWGLSYAMNLTPDAETGIGLWSEQVFVNAIRTGRHMGVGRPIMPPMPWPMYSQMTDDDLRAVYAYLRSLPPRKNKIPEAVVAPPAAPPS